MLLINKICLFFKLFYRQQQGVVLFEFAAVMFGFSMVCFLLVDLGSAFITQSRMERTTYALASVLRERVALYNGNEIITAGDVTELKKLADTLLPGDSAIRVDALHFESGPVQQFKQGQQFGIADSQQRYCGSTLPSILTIRSLAPQSKIRWMPIYRVTLCRPTDRSWFKSLVNPSRGASELVIEELVASVVVLPR